MHVIQYSTRIYFSLFLFLCVAVLFAPSVANANEFWSTYEKRMISQSEVSNRVNRILSQATSIPSGSTLSTAPSAPTVTKNPLGGLSQTTQNTIKNMGYPSSFNSTLNNSAASAKTALKSCVRSPACAGRALGAGAIIYEGIQAWKEVYDFVFDEQQQEVLLPSADKSYENQGGLITLSGLNELVQCSNISHNVADVISCIESNVRPESGVVLFDPVQLSSTQVKYKLGYENPPPPWSWGTVVFVTTTSFEESPTNYNPVPAAELDQMIDDSYVPEVSDAPIVLLSGDPESITFSTPASVELPSTTTTNTSASGQTTTSVTNKTINYNVTNNNTANPSINSSLVETTTTYDTTGNITDTTTSTTTANGVQPDVSTPSPSAPLDLELPPFCTWASIVCDWIGWTKEGIEGEEPDLINLISEFEPDENYYNSGIGSGSCPAPMSLNLVIINRTVEVSYQPFCDFLDMIRPLVIAGAWLLSAFMYVGVLRRG